MRASVFALVALVFVLPILGSVVGAADRAPVPPCNAIELIAGQTAALDEDVCQAVADFQRGNYREAAEALERASTIPLLEFPNFSVLPRLALAHWRAGNREKAHAALAQAELALLVFVHNVRCAESSGGGFFLSHDGKTPITHTFRNEVAERMCGDALSSRYEQKSLEEVVYDAALIKFYFEVRDEIAGK